MASPPHSFDEPPRQTAHGDLLVHELRAIGQGVFEHELLFRKGAAWTIQFRGFEHRVEAVVPPSPAS
jgi:hypothetical protein